MKRQIDKFDEELQKQFDDTKFVDDVGDDLYINNVEEANEAAHGDGANTLRNKSYGYIMIEQFTEKDYIDNVAYDNYICAEVVMGVPGEGSRQEKVGHRVEDLDGEKVVTYHRNPQMDT